MGKRLADIKIEVDNSRFLFMEYMQRNLDSSVHDFILKLSSLTEVYVFSGIIRNFFLNENDLRDIDLIIGANIDIQELFPEFEIRKNSFGGYKINVNNTNVDLWHLESTWAIKYQKMIDYELYKYIPSTAFFNFSAVIFFFNKTEFHCGNPFLSFLRERKINFVYKPNANYALCVVNSLYYSDKYNLPLANKLKRYLKELSKKKLDYKSVQEKHFGKILYSDDMIKMRIDKLLLI